MRARTTRAFALVAVATVSAGCGDMSQPQSTASNDITCVDAPTPDTAYVESEDETCAYFVEFGGGGEESEGDAGGEDVATTAASYEEARPRLVYLNRDGGVFKQGKNNSSRDISSLVNGQAEIPAYPGSNEEWDELTACVERRFARFDLDFTQEDPGASPHIEAVVGGHPCQLGLNDRVRGVAPLANNCSVVERAVVYAFAHNIKDPKTACEVTAHEIGHALGLDHEYLCDDPMTYLSCGHRSFQDVDAQCGTTEARDCACSERQNTVEHLFSVLGERPDADLEPPSVRVVSPSPNEELSGHDTVDIEIEAEDDDGVAAVKLVWESDKTYTVDCAAPIGNVSCNDDGEGRYTFRLRATTGSRTFRVTAIDQSGNSAATERQRIDLLGDDEPPVITRASASSAP